MRRSANVLPRTKIGIAEQFPKEIEEARKSLYPVMKKAKAEGHKISLIKHKLYISGLRYQGEVSVTQESARKDE